MSGESGTASPFRRRQGPAPAETRERRLFLGGTDLSRSVSHLFTRYSVLCWWWQGFQAELSLRRDENRLSLTPPWRTGLESMAPAISSTRPRSLGRRQAQRTEERGRPLLSGAPKQASPLKGTGAKRDKNRRVGSSKFLFKNFFCFELFPFSNWNIFRLAASSFSISMVSEGAQSAMTGSK